MRTTNPDFSIPLIRDELRFATRHALMQNPARDTLTFRNRQSETALPMRELGSFLPGEGVGGAGVHWNGTTWRWSSIDHALRSHYEARYGKAFIPRDMPAQDWPISYQELEPYYDRFERTAGVSGKAGNLQGARQDGGNVFEAARAREYPLPPLESSYAQVIFAETSAQSGYHPFPRPSANASRAYTNPDGARLGACVYCGHCERFGCEANAKGSPHITVIPQAIARSNFELRTARVGDQGAPRLDEAQSGWRLVHEYLDRRGVRAAGRDRRALRLRDQQRAPHASRSRGNAAMGCRLEEGDGEVVPEVNEYQCHREQHAEPL